MTSRNWTPWTACLAWGELLTSWHRDSDPERWLRWHPEAPVGTAVETEAHVEAQVTVLVGLAVHAVVVARQETPETITSPRDLRAARLGFVGLALAQREQVHTLLLDPHVGPETSPTDPVGHEEAAALEVLYHKVLFRNETLRWDAITQLAKAVGTWHLEAEEYRDQATLGDRLATYETQQQKRAAREDRQVLVNAAALVHREF